MAQSEKWKSMLEKEKQRLAEDEPEELDEVISQAPLHPSVKIN